MISNNTTERAGRRAGFTLIELLIVVVIIGILAAIAVPKFANSKEKAFVSRMKGDLRNLVTAQESYIADNPAGYYGGALPAAGMTYNPSPDVTITMVVATASGWSATAAMPGITTRTCAIFYGNAPALAPATSEGSVACT